jgi:small subunit ribosomal protein S2
MTNTYTSQNDYKKYIDASLQYGHRPKEWNPKMAPYILNTQYGYHIFDLNKTSKFLKLAGNILQQNAKNNAKILFVGTNKISAPIIAKLAMTCNAFYINFRWLGGLLTNWATIQTQIDNLKRLELQYKNGEFKNLSKKDCSNKQKELKKLRSLFQGIQGMNYLPDIVIFTSPLKDITAINECKKLGIPAISIMDSNCNPDSVTYPIPANDDSRASVTFILNYLTNRIIAGIKQKRRNT